ncbi:hypothetical protein BSL78_20165 [Apostichopus japonicus]|uniref:Uncharacterized protein n=1 Tax=Stichopus japonicus TaxID=307972 RepID=A0A2G8K4Q3_STIJA|nr:hypothetical protein BSL78_20165 [Apostichopus japonicus]
MMKLALFFLSCTVLAGLIAAQDFGMIGVDVADMMPVTQVGPDEKPSHGVCFIEPDLVCDTIGALIAYTGANNCISCVCGEDFGVICCRDRPYPVVADPDKCSLYLDPVSCHYKRHPRCKPYCAVTGWYYTNLGDLIDF